MRPDGNAPRRNTLAAHTWMIAGAILLVPLTGCGDSIVGPGTPRGAEITEGHGSTVVAAEATPLSILIVDDAGRGVPGVPVNWEIIRGAGALSQTNTMTSSGGVASVVWTSSGEAGTGRVAARPEGVNAVFIEFEVVPGEKSRIETSQDRIDLTYLGERESLSVQTTDDHGNQVPGDVTWTISDTTVVALDNDKQITALNVGDALLELSSGTVTRELPVSVRQIPSTVTSSPSEVNFEAIGDSLAIDVEVRDAGGSIIPVGAEQVSWFTGSSSIASVSETGVIQARGPGETRITGEIAGALASIDVVVEPKVVTVEVQTDKGLLTWLGEPVNFTARARDRNGHVITSEPADFKWTTTNGRVIEVDEDGIGRAVGNGAVSVRASRDGVHRSMLLKVEQQTTEIEVAPSEVSMDTIGQMVQLVAQPYDLGGSEIEVVLNEFTFSSRNTSVATVSSGGTVIAQGQGSTIVNIEHRGYTTQVSVWVSPSGP